MSTKDFAEGRTIADDVEFLRESMKSTRDGSFCSTEFSRAALERIFTAALRVPSPPSEDFLSVRDQFAKAAMQGFCVQGGTKSIIVKESWELADLMMKAREVKA